MLYLALLASMGRYDVHFHCPNDFSSAPCLAVIAVGGAWHPHTSLYRMDGKLEAVDGDTYVGNDVVHLKRFERSRQSAFAA